MGMAQANHAPEATKPARIHAVPADLVSAYDNLLDVCRDSLRLGLSRDYRSVGAATMAALDARDRAKLR